MWISNSFAKINLGLHVLEKLPTGYHNIETGLCFIEWKDRFEVTPAEEFSLTMPGSSVPTDNRNLITRAYQAFERYIGLKNHYAFSVIKDIPAGAGLGGGSSNAALTLRILNKLEETDLSNDDLADISRGLGTDIPFFIHGEPGVGTGLGQKIKPLPIQPGSWIVTVYPGFESSTEEAYGACIPNPDPDFSIEGVLLDEEPEEWKYLLTNELEQTVIPRYELIGNIKDQMEEFGAAYASMSGSGSTVYGIFTQDFVAIHAYESFHELGFPANLTRPDFKPDHGIYLRE